MVRLRPDYIECREGCDGGEDGKAQAEYARIRFSPIIPDKKFLKTRDTVRLCRKANVIKAAITVQLSIIP